MRSIVLSLLIISLTTLAQANIEATNLVDQISDNSASEFAECAAFFTLISRSLEKTSYAEASSKYDDLSTQAAIYSREFSQSGRDAEMADKVTLARFKFYLEDMLTEIDYNLSNTSILFSDHLQPCINSMEDPIEVFKRWSNKIEN